MPYLKRYCETLDSFLTIPELNDDAQREFIAIITNNTKESNVSTVFEETILIILQEINPSLKKITLSADVKAELQIMFLETNPNCSLTAIAVKTGEKEQPTTVYSKKKEALSLKSYLSSHIIGQSEAIDIVTRQVQRHAVGLNDIKRPLGSFMFLGPTGVGKTELVKKFTEHIFGSEYHLIKVDCSEYANPHEYAKLIGSPPGYIGFNEGGYLCERAKELVEFVVLFDEVEKAHTKMHHILLQLLDEGILTTSKGEKISFKKSYVFMTSNVGAGDLNRLTSKIGFGDSEAFNFREKNEEVMNSFKKEFTPEFINRLDYTVLFNNINIDDCYIITDKFLRELKAKLSIQNINFTYTSDTVKYLSKKAYSFEYGARHIKRIVSTEVEDAIVQVLINIDSNPHTILMDMKDNELSFNTSLVESSAIA